MGLKLRKAMFENFANLYTGLHVTRLEIDFSKQKNIICVIIGRNGRGKTSLLSYLSPFSGLGNIDDRSGENLIINKMKGYKRIIYESDIGDEYDIEHFYIPQKVVNDKTVYSIKSYIKKNGIELNENGNVRSFESLVFELLGIDPDYMRLIRIGDNVKNLINSKTAERKVFMGKLLTEVDEYLRIYKKKTQQVSELKAVVTHIADEITKTGITDIHEANKMIKQLEKELLTITKSIEKTRDKESRAKYELEIIGFPDTGDHEIKVYSSRLSKYDDLISSLGNISSDVLNKSISSKELERTKKIASLEVLNYKQSSLIDQIDELLQDIHENEIEIEKEEKNLNISTMRHTVTELRKAMNMSYETRFDEIEFRSSKKEFEDLVIFLKNLQTTINGIYEYGKEPIREVIKLMQEHKSVPDYINGALITMEITSRPEDARILDKLIMKYKKTSYACDQSSGCPYKALYDDLMIIKNAKALPSNEKLRDITFYHSMNSVRDGLEHVFASITSKINAIDFINNYSYPESICNIFSKESLLKHISNLEMIYDDNEINSWLNFVSDREHYRDLVDEYNKQSERLADLEKNSRASYFSEKISSDRKRLSNLTNEKELVDDEIVDITKDISKLTDTLEELKEKLDALLMYEQVRAEFIDLQAKQEKFKAAKDKLSECSNIINDLLVRQGKLNTELSVIRSSMDRYLLLKEELKEKTEILEILENIKYASANTKGLPLFYIKWYLQDTVDIANRILDIIYDGEKYLNTFEISETEFLMPYTIGDITIPDVSLASQGEKSFFNMAISSALSTQCMEQYNIALFDEIDSVFDDENRQKTIPVIEELLAIGNINQAFLITHNQMFNQYPTDVLDLDNLENSTIPVTWNLSI